MFLCSGMFSPPKIACFGIFILPRISDPLYLGKLANILKSRGGDLKGDFTGRHLELCLDRHFRCLLSAYHRGVRLLWIFLEDLYYIGNVIVCVAVGIY